MHYIMCISRSKHNKIITTSAYNIYIYKYAFVTRAVIYSRCSVYEHFYTMLYWYAQRRRLILCVRATSASGLIAHFYSVFFFLFVQYSVGAAAAKLYYIRGTLLVAMTSFLTRTCNWHTHTHTHTQHRTRIFHVTICIN